MEISRDTKLRRREAAKALQALGFPITESTLATKATRGGGPPYQLFGRIPIYTWGQTIDWAESRLSPEITTTSELDAMRGEAA